MAVLFSRETRRLLCKYYPWVLSIVGHLIVAGAVIYIWRSLSAHFAAPVSDLQEQVFEIEIVPDSQLEQRYQSPALAEATHR